MAWSGQYEPGVEDMKKSELNEAGENQTKSYEEAMAELEDMVKKLEKGDLTLEASIEYFQKGVELSKYCSKRLDEAERRIMLLVENSKGELVEEEMPEV